MPADQQWLIEDVIVRAISALQDLVLTLPLEQALYQLISTLEQANRLEMAAVVRSALQKAREEISR